MTISNNTTGLQRILETVNALPEAGAGGGIIDVVKLPTEDISESSFYRLVTATVVYNQNDCTESDYICYCVDGLPEAGLPATNADMTVMNIYYNIQDDVGYGYIDDTLSAGLGVSIGWHEVSALLTVAGESYGGVITDIDDDPCDDATRILLKYDFYLYKNGWMKLPFAYEKAPKFDIQWDGVIGDKFVLDMSALGFEGIQMVKVSDQSLTVDQLIGSNYFYNDSLSEHTIQESNTDTISYPGGVTINNGEIVSIYSADDTNTALGLPSGYLTNGLYFFYIASEEQWMRRLVAPSKIVKLDSKYIEADFSEYATTSEVDAKINQAIGNAIGGSY